MSKLTGRLVSGFGSFYTVEINGEFVEARARGRIKKNRSKLYIGDIVELEKEQETYAIIDVKERKNCIIRPAVANVDRIIVVLSAKSPDINYKQTDKLLAFLEHHNLEVVICINKCDLKDCEEVKDIYTKAGYKVIVTSSVDNVNIDKLKEELKGRITAFAGCSGVGKSSLINTIDEKFCRTTGEVGKIERGKHTTTHASLLPLEFGGYIADTPGFSVVDISDVKKEDLSGYFKEFSKYSENCMFRGCTHKNAKNCEIIEKVKSGEIAQSRYDSYIELFDELSDIYQYK